MSAGSNTPSLSAGRSSLPAELPKEAITIIRDRLYFVPSWNTAPPRDTSKVHYLCTDDQFRYEPFFADFGPLNLSCICKYARMVDNKVSQENSRYSTDYILDQCNRTGLNWFRWFSRSLLHGHMASFVMHVLQLETAEKQNQVVVHYVSSHPEKRANAVLLMGAAQQLLLGLSAEEAFRPFRALTPRLATFRDASCGPCSFKLTVLDCLEGLEMAINLGWFDYKTFDVEAYDFYEKIENGDLNWIIPKKFIAFSCPSASSSSSWIRKGQRETSSCCTPEDYVHIFKRLGVKLVVCLNNRPYDAKKFTKRSIDHADLFFVDGTCPSRDIIESFFRLVENRGHPIAVHCKAGLGRTGTLIGCFAIKNYRFRAAAWIGWNRLCRPGSVLGPQQQFLSDIQHDLMQMSIAENLVRTRPLSPALNAPPVHLKEDISDCLAKLTLEERLLAECGDAEQGERLLTAKRKQQAATLQPESAGLTALVTQSPKSRVRSSKTILALPALVPHAVASGAPQFRSVRMGKSGIVVSTLTGSTKRAPVSAGGDATAAAATVVRSQVSTT